MNLMRLLFIGSFVLFGLSVSAQNGGKETLSVKTNIYCDHCNKCESCGPRIYNQLMDVPGIRKVKIDDEASTILVTYNSDKIEPKSIRDAINAAGFDADDQPAPADAVAKLDGCCKKS
ncbi:MAG: hypothetical protein Salg2KO_00150 [Salibacteraceae bacterium]